MQVLIVFPKIFKRKKRPANYKGKQYTFKFLGMFFALNT